METRSIYLEMGGRGCNLNQILKTIELTSFFFLRDVLKEDTCSLNQLNVNCSIVKEKNLAEVL